MIILAALAAAGCTATPDVLARNAAKDAIRPVLARNPVPGVPLEPASDCVIDNAQTAELLALAADAATGPTASTAEIVARILSRPPTQSCLGTAYIAVLADGAI